MPHGPLYLFFLAFAALVSVAMWLDYFRQIDVFEKEKITNLLLALIIGGLTPSISLFIYRFLDSIHFVENGEFINDALFSILGIGLNEELCKLTGIFLVFQLLKKQINEPIDYLIYAGVTALGFSLVENSRTFYSALEHIINSTIIVYGFYRSKLFNKGNVILNSITGIVLAVMSHGLFDFFLDDGFLGPFTSLLSLFIYLIGINFWVQMLNNANNYSTFFDYHKINFTPRLVFRLFYWYAITVMIAFMNNYIMTGFVFSTLTFLKELFSDGLLFWMVILRVSRFKIFKMKYFKVVPALPFYITKNEDEDLRIPLLDLKIKIRGENFREHLLTKYLNKKVELYPVDERISFIKSNVSAVIKDKYLLFEDVVIYEVAIEDHPNPNQKLYVLKPKMRGIKEMGYRYPIEGLYSIDALDKTLNLSQIGAKELKFIEWVYLKPDHLGE
jgi:RsiW-degrading membrane proteinase PrsW (M82 family)